MPFFSNVLKNIKDIFWPAPVPTEEERRMAEPAIPLVWNDEKVLLDTHAKNGDYFFEHFTGHLVCFKTECEVQDAAFRFHAGAMKYLAGAQPPPGLCPGLALLNNWIIWKNGTLLSGHLNCRSWKNGTVSGGELLCDGFETGTVNGGTVNCTEWRGGTVNNGKLQCIKWLCGTFNGGTIQGTGKKYPLEWKDGIFNGGTFRGEWYGGIWNGGTFKGKVLVGDGTFEWISANRKREE